MGLPRAQRRLHRRHPHAGDDGGRRRSRARRPVVDRPLPHSADTGRRPGGGGHRTRGPLVDEHVGPAPPERPPRGHCPRCLLGGRDGPEYSELEMPSVPPAADVPTRGVEGAPPHTEMFDFRPAVGGAPFTAGDEALTGGWFRFREPQLANPVVMTAYADGWFPAVFSRTRDPIGVPHRGPDRARPGAASALGCDTGGLLPRDLPGARSPTAASWSRTARSGAPTGASSPRPGSWPSCSTGAERPRRGRTSGSACCARRVTHSPSFHPPPFPAALTVRSLTTMRPGCDFASSVSRAASFTGSPTTVYS